MPYYGEAVRVIHNVDVDGEKKSVTVSVLRSTEDLHYTTEKGTRTGEIMVQVEGEQYWRDYWCGWAGHAGEAFRYALDKLRQGHSLDAVENGLNGW